MPAALAAALRDLLADEAQRSRMALAARRRRGRGPYSWDEAAPPDAASSTAS